MNWAAQTLYDVTVLKWAAQALYDVPGLKAVIKKATMEFYVLQVFRFSVSLCQRFKYTGVHCNQLGPRFRVGVKRFNEKGNDFGQKTPPRLTRPR